MRKIFAMLWIFMASCSDANDPRSSRALQVSELAIRDIAVKLVELDHRAGDGEFDTIDSPIAVHGFPQFDVLYCRADEYSRSLLDLIASGRLSDLEEKIASLALAGVSDSVFLYLHSF